MEPINSHKRIRTEEESSASATPQEAASLSSLEAAAAAFFQIASQLIPANDAQESTRQCTHGPLIKRIAFLKDEISKMKAIAANQFSQASFGTASRPIVIHSSEVQKLDTIQTLDSETVFQNLIKKAASDYAKAIGHHAFSDVAQKHLHELVEKWPTLKSSVSHAHREFYDCLLQYNFSLMPLETLGAIQASDPIKAEFKIFRQIFHNAIPFRQSVILDPILTACMAYYFKNPAFQLIYDCFRCYLAEGHTHAILKLHIRGQQSDLVYLISIRHMLEDSRKGTGFSISPCTQQIDLKSQPETWSLSPQHLFSKCDPKIIEGIIEYAAKLLKIPILLCRKPWKEEQLEIEKGIAAFEQFSQIAGIADTLTDPIRTAIEIAKSFSSQNHLKAITCSFTPISQFCHALLYSIRLRETPPRSWFLDIIAKYSSRTALLKDKALGQGSEFSWDYLQQYPIEVEMKASILPEDTVRKRFTLDEFIAFIAHEENIQLIVDKSRDAIEKEAAEQIITRYIFIAAEAFASQKLIQQSQSCQSHIVALKKLWPTLKDKVSRELQEFYQCLVQSYFAALPLPSRNGPKHSIKTPFRAIKQISHIDSSNKPCYIFDYFLTACIAYSFKNPSSRIIQTCFKIYMRANARTLIAIRSFSADDNPYFQPDLARLAAGQPLLSVLAPFQDKAKVTVVKSFDNWIISSTDVWHLGYQLAFKLQESTWCLTRYASLSLCCPESKEIQDLLKTALAEFTELGTNVGILETLTSEITILYEIAKGLATKESIFDITCAFAPLAQLCRAMAHSKALRESPPRAFFKDLIEAYTPREHLPEPIKKALLEKGDSDSFWKACQQFPIIVAMPLDDSQKLTFTLDEYISYIQNQGNTDNGLGLPEESQNTGPGNPPNDEALDEFLDFLKTPPLT